ncbi:MAG: diguanylate cyclase [Clostridia bacterium]
METYLNIDINLISALFLVFLSTYILKQFPSRAPEIKCLKAATYTGLIALLSESLNVVMIYDILPNTMPKLIIHHIAMLITYLAAAALPLMWTCFLYHYMQKKTDGNIKCNKLLLIPFILAVCIVLPTPFTGLMYKTNMVPPVYERGPLYMLVAAFELFYIVYNSIFIWSNRKHLSSREFLTLFAFEIFPFVGAVIQVMFTGVLLIWPLTTVGLILTYVYLQNSVVRYDPLTNGWNMRAFESFMDEQIKRNKKDFSLCFIDIDELEYINNTFGISEGDLSLKSFSKIILNTLPKDAHFVRYDGDKFIIFFNSLDLKKFLDLMKEIDLKVHHLNENSKKKYNIKYTYALDALDVDKYKSYSQLIRHLVNDVYEKKEKRKTMQTSKEKV